MVKTRIEAGYRYHTAGGSLVGMRDEGVSEERDECEGKEGARRI